MDNDRIMNPAFNTADGKGTIGRSIPHEHSFGEWYEAGGPGHRHMRRDCSGCPMFEVEEVKTSDLYTTGRFAKEVPDYLASMERDRDWVRLTNNRHISMIRHAPVWTVLDIGCGCGHFMEDAKAAGWSAAGIEPCPPFADECHRRGLTVWKGTFEDYDFKIKFGAVRMAMVLEHVANPFAVVSKVADVLMPGGVFIVEVPNDGIGNAMQDAAGGDWWRSPHHVTYFNRGIIENMIDSVGLRIERMTTSFPMELFLLMGMDYRGHPEVGAKCHEMRKRFELGSSRVAWTMYDALAQVGIGRTIIAVARKGA